MRGKLYDPPMRTKTVTRGSYILTLEETGSDPSVSAELETKDGKWYGSVACGVLRNDQDEERHTPAYIDTWATHQEDLFHTEVNG